MRSVLIGVLVASAALFVACDSARDIATAGAGECTACHGYPPPPFIAGGTSHTTLTDCSTCHPTTVEEDDVTLVTGGTHLNGQVDASGGHPVPFVAQHPSAAVADIASCAVCHGADYGGGSAGVSCNACHSSFGYADWKTNCTFCHGARTQGWTVAELPVAAPPESVAGATAATDPAVGAHQAHVAAGTFVDPIECSNCHAVPAAAFPGSLDHLDGSPTLAFSALATQGVASPGYSGGTCAVYCHGPTLVGGTGTEPNWTAPGSVACGSCHGTPPANGPASFPNAHNFHVSNQNVPCSRCHDGYTTTTTNTSFHVDGVKDVVVVPTGGGTQRINGWDCNACHAALGV